MKSLTVTWGSSLPAGSRPCHGGGSVIPSSEGVPVVGRLSAEPVPAADGPVSAEDGVLVAVQLGLGHHQAGVVISAAVFDTCTKKNTVRFLLYLISFNFGGCTFHYC